MPKNFLGACLIMLTYVIFYVQLSTYIFFYAISTSQYMLKSTHFGEPLSNSLLNFLFYQMLHFVLSLYQIYPSLHILFIFLIEYWWSANYTPEKINNKNQRKIKSLFFQFFFHVQAEIEFHKHPIRKLGRILDKIIYLISVRNAKSYLMK